LRAPNNSKAPLPVKINSTDYTFEFPQLQPIFFCNEGHAGDTDFIPEMKQIGPIDMALLPIGGTYTMDINDAVEAAMAINPAAVIPMHYLNADPREFKNKLKSHTAINVLSLQIGEAYRLS
jgi:L-ascorbate metabolism protein UlaG (beta-lactamase superfamily)